MSNPNDPAQGGALPSVPLQPVVLLSDVLEVFRKRNDIPQDLKPIQRVEPYHGPCCCCQTCGRDYDNCVCQLNELLADLMAIPKQNPSRQPRRECGVELHGFVGGTNQENE